MPTHESVASMVGSYAEQAVQQARDRNAQLDYSEHSLLEVEVILSQLAKQMNNGSAPEELAEVCKTWGSYFGEVVRRQFGGEWSIETYPGKQFATLTLNVGGHKLFPSMKVHRRLTSGEGESLWSFYKMVKARLEAAPGGKVQ